MLDSVVGYVVDAGQIFLKSASVLTSSFAGTFLVGLVVFIFLRYLIETKLNPGPKKRSLSSTNVSEEEECSATVCCKNAATDENARGSVKPVLILYGTTTGKSKGFATSLSVQLLARGVNCEIKDLAEFGKSIEEDFQALPTQYRLLILLISTYTEGTPPDSCKWFYSWIKDFSSDFRVQHSVFKEMNFSVFGLGNSLYGEHFNTIATSLDSFLHNLSAKRFLPVELGDENVLESKNGNLEADFKAWSNVVEGKLCDSTTEQGEKEQQQDSAESGFSSNDTEDEEDSEADSEAEEEEKEDDLVDLEDLGKVMSKAKKPVKLTGEPKEMVTPQLRKSLTKQGYKIIGSHSGVKLCRWTKSMLRGRGGCYKHTFYGIESHRCMETTPSLACANKCVFCWRHHSNPVGTEWRWKMDDAETILKGALDNHYKMINEFKGAPGVLPEKLAEGMAAQHCALSLVGEPIMYPEINKFVNLLHSKGISSFLVTNAQFPDAIRDMSPCTQLYVSIDASTKESLKKIDRPLFKDFWERFIQSLKELSAKGQRTVYRLTLVKGWNAEEMDNYASLVNIGKPDFIEIKGVTFCGSSKASTLTMENVPWHEEVVKFVKELTSRLPDYDISCEHEHSNCVLVSNKKFYVDGKWNTWINYSKFHELVTKYYASNGTESFSGLDYMAETPSWAVYGSNERGFDPLEKRWKRKGKLEVNVDGGCG